MNSTATLELDPATQPKASMTPHELSGDFDPARLPASLVETMYALYELHDSRPGLNLSDFNLGTFDFHRDPADGRLWLDLPLLEDRKIAPIAFSHSLDKTAHAKAINASGNEMEKIALLLLEVFGNEEQRNNPKQAKAVKESLGDLKGTASYELGQDGQAIAKIYDKEVLVDGLVATVTVRQPLAPGLDIEPHVPSLIAIRPFAVYDDLIKIERGEEERARRRTRGEDVKEPKPERLDYCQYLTPSVSIAMRAIDGDQSKTSRANEVLNAILTIHEHSAETNIYEIHRDLWRDSLARAAIESHFDSRLAIKDTARRIGGLLEQLRAKNQ